MSTVGVFFAARMGSKRLPGKHLLEASGMPMLGVLVNRMLFYLDRASPRTTLRFVVTTADTVPDRALEVVAKGRIEIYFGSPSNIPLRHLQAAQALSVDAVVAIDGDDVLCSPKAAEAVLRALENGEKYVKTSGMPLGMNAFGYSTEFLRSSMRNHERETLETGWGRIFDESHLKSLDIGPRLKIDRELRFTLDYPEDLAFFRSIIESFGSNIVSTDDDTIIKYVMQHGLYELTDPISERYWLDFETVKSREMTERFSGQ